MREVAVSTITGLLLCALFATAQAQAQSFAASDPAQVSRDIRPSTAKAPKVYDNDNLPSADVVNIVGSVPHETSNSNSGLGTNLGAESDNNRKNKKDVAEIKVGQSLTERQEVYKHWEKRIAKRAAAVEQLTRELDELKRNAPMSVAILHLWPDDQMYLQVVRAKQDALDQAKANLSDLQEEARKAGVPSSFRDGAPVNADEAAKERKTEYSTAMSEIQLRKTGATASDKSDETDADESGPADSETKTRPPQKDPIEITPGQSPEERKEVYRDWKKRIEIRKSDVDRLSRELDDLKKNVPTAVILHLWPEDQMYLQMLANKQKAIDEAKAALSDSQELARKAGVPSSFAY
jgi:hypothetical protein